MIIETHCLLWAVWPTGATQGSLLRVSYDSFSLQRLSVVLKIMVALQEGHYGCDLIEPHILGSFSLVLMRAVT